MRDRVERTASLLGPKRDRVVVAAIAGNTVEIAGDAEAVHEIGSITKVFTALALSRLTLDGVVGLDEPLADLLPSAPPRIRLRDLATHTSGLPRLPTGMLLPALLNPGQPDPYAGCDADFLEAALRRTRLKAPRFRYSNFGAGLLGLALSRRTGLGYDELLRPPGLNSTSVFRTPIQGHNARGKLWHNGGTGGFCSFAGLEPARGVAVVALTNTARLMDRPALELLTALGED